MIRLTAKNVIALHKQMIEKTGGSYGVRDEGLLESALASPFMTYDQIELFPSVYQKAARLCFGFVKNHPFIDGNKRIGTQLMLILLKKSGIELFYTQEELIEVILHVADGAYHLAIPLLSSCGDARLSRYLIEFDEFDFALVYVCS